MTRKELENEIQLLKNQAFIMVRESSPVRTGNLQRSVRVEDLPDGGFQVYIDTKQAPYAIHTLEKWTHKRWHGRPNPNEGWAYWASERFINYATARLKRGE